MKIAIVGGGAVGLSSALWLSSNGHAVDVYERGAFGGAAMGAAAGILGAQSESDAPHAGFERYLRARALWQAMAQRGPGGADALGYRQSGLLKLGGLEHEAAFFETQRWQSARGARAELLAGQALRARFPHVGEGMTCGLWLPDEAQVEPPLVAQTLVNLLAQLGCSLHPYTEAPALPELVARYDHVLVAAGVGAAQLLPELALVPVRGQLLEKRLRHPEASAAALPVLMYGHTYAVPRGDGRVVVGATVEHGRDDVQIDAACTDTLERCATLLWPALAQQPTRRHWAGLRPFLAGGPVLQQVQPGLWVSTGHYRCGILLALDAGEQVAARLQGEEPNHMDPRLAVDALYTRINAISRG